MSSQPRKNKGNISPEKFGLAHLGDSGLFHFRGTVGAIFNRVEVHTGYEYHDFDRTQTNALIGGARIWF